MSTLDTPLAEDFRKETWTLKDQRKVTVTRSSTVAGRWRFCTDGRRVTVLPWEASGETTSLDSIVECESLAHCCKVIEGKGLKIADADQPAWNQTLADNGMPHDPRWLQPAEDVGRMQ